MYSERIEIIDDAERWGYQNALNDVLSMLEKMDQAVVDYHTFIRIKNLIESRLDAVWTG